MNDADVKGLMCGVADSYEKIAAVYDMLAELHGIGPDGSNRPSQADDARHSRVTPNQDVEQMTAGG